MHWILHDVSCNQNLVTQLPLLLISFLRLSVGKPQPPCFRTKLASGQLSSRSNITQHILLHSLLPPTVVIGAVAANLHTRVSFVMALMQSQAGL